MLRFVTCKIKVHEGDLIAIVKNSKFIGYGSVVAAFNGNALLDIDKKVNKTFNELDYETIPYNFTIE